MEKSYSFIDEIYKAKDGAGQCKTDKVGCPKGHHETFLRRGYIFLSDPAAKTNKPPVLSGGLFKNLPYPVQNRRKPAYNCHPSFFQLF